MSSFGAVELRPVSDEGTLARIVALEAASYPAAEAASAAQLRYRMLEANDCFRAVYLLGDLVGFLCGTRCRALTHEAMSVHDAEGPILAVHSVCVAAAVRRQGVATRALKRYLRNAASLPGVASVQLIAKAALLPLYTRVGFRILGVSAIVHGADAWFDCSFDARWPIPYAVVDAFATRPYAGNSAGVVFLDPDWAETASDLAGWMQAVAMENNLSETAFLQQLPDETFSLRWFTPTVEVDLCGHATLAAAHALFESGRAALTEPLRFVSERYGVLTATRLEGGLIELDFPLDEAQPCTLDAATMAALRAGLGFSPEVEILALKRSTQNDLLVEVASAATVASIEPSAADLARVIPARGIVPCALGDVNSARACDFSSRFFGPAAGIDEDPVTGSAHCALAPHFAARLGRLRAGAALRGYQAHERVKKASKRGGVVACAIDATATRVKLAGKAFTTLRGAIPPPP